MPLELFKGQRFSGPVVYVGDGDSLCVALGRGPDRWAEVRLADWYAPELNEAQGREAKAVLGRIAMGKRSTACPATAAMTGSSRLAASTVARCPTS